MKALNPYLNFFNSEEAFNFYKSVFGGEFLTVARFKDTPGAEVPADQGNGIMHIALPVGPANMHMATDALESMGHTVKPGNQISLSIEAESREEADKLFNGLSAGGKVGMPLTDMFWGSYWGQLTDKFGIGWMVNYTPAKQ
jgi:PhnB protein